MRTLFLVATLLTLSMSVTIVNDNPVGAMVKLNEVIACAPDTTPRNAVVPRNFASEQYRDMRTGQVQSLYYDKQKNMLFDRSTGRPVSFYSNAITGDTLSRAGNYNTNNYLFVSPGSNYRIDTGRIRIPGNMYRGMRSSQGLLSEPSWEGRQNRQ